MKSNLQKMLWRVAIVMNVATSLFASSHSTSTYAQSPMVEQFCEHVWPLARKISLTIIGTGIVTTCVLPQSWVYFKEVLLVEAILLGGSAYASSICSNVISEQDMRKTKTQEPKPEAETERVCYTTPKNDVKPLDCLPAQDVPALTWEINPQGQPRIGWEEAVAYCQDKGNGWRLPSVWELSVLYQQGDILHKANSYNWSWFWSSTRSIDTEDVNLIFSFKNGAIWDRGTNMGGYNVRCVQSGRT